MECMGIGSANTRQFLQPAHGVYHGYTIMDPYTLLEKVMCSTRWSSVVVPIVLSKVPVDPPKLAQPYPGPGFNFGS